MRTRAEWTERILADLATAWKHVEEKEGAVTDVTEAWGMATRSCELILSGEAETLGHGMAHVVLMLTWIRETAIAHAEKKAAAS